MSDQKQTSTQRAKFPADVKNMTPSSPSLQVIEDLYARFIDHQIEHGIEPGSNGWKSALEFIRRPENRQQAERVFKEIAEPAIKRAFDPVYSTLKAGLVDKFRK